MDPELSFVELHQAVHVVFSINNKYVQMALHCMVLKLYVPSFGTWGLNSTLSHVQITEMRHDIQPVQLSTDDRLRAE